jgi:CHASE2 domain-containing sensor protein/class 3 adenylate cyclase
MWKAWAKTDEGGPRLVLAVAIALGLVLVLREQGVLMPIERALYDRWVQVRPNRPLDDRIVVVGITETDIRRLPTWPLPDDLLAAALDRIQAAKPAVIGIDLYRHLPRPPGSQQLARALQAPNVITIQELDGNPGPPAAYGAQPPLDRVGFNDVIYDDDGVVRRALLLTQNERGDVFQAFALMLALAYLQPRRIIAEASPQNPDWMRLGQTTLIPLEPDSGQYRDLDAAGYQIWLDYRGRNNIVDIVPLQNLLAAQVTPDRLTGKVVLIGTLAESSRDLFFTPYSPTERYRARMAGVLLHAQIVSQLLDLADGRRRLPWFWAAWQELAWIVGWTIAGGVVAQGLPVLARSSLAIGGVWGAIGLAGLALLNAGAWIPIVAPGLGAGLAWGAVAAVRGQQARQQRQMAMKLLGLNASPAVAKTLWRDRHRVIESGRLPGQKLVATIVFTDIRNFSTIAERLAPEILLDWLNEYLDALTREVLARDGVVNKFTGDGILAMFGAPVPRTKPSEIAADAERAVDCALAMRAQLIRLNQSWHSRRLPVIQMRVGIYTGEVVVGSLGGRDRLEYGVLGDSTNVASRLESCMKERQPDNCRILVGDATVAALGDLAERFALESWGITTLKGKHQRVNIYHVNGRRSPED